MDDDVLTITKERLRGVLACALGADDGDVNAIWTELANTEPQVDQLPLDLDPA